MVSKMGWRNRLWRQSGAPTPTPAATGPAPAYAESPDAESSVEPEEEVGQEPDLGIQAEEDLADPLLNALDDSDPWVRMSAIEAMGARGDPRDTARLLGALKDPSSSVRVFAIIALADRISPDMRDSLIEATNDSENIVRGRAIDAIASFGDPRDTARLLGALKDPSSSVRVSAIIALTDRLSPDMRDSLIEATNDSENIVRGRAIDAIASFGDPRDTARLLGALKDPSSSVRVSAIIALTDRLSPDMRDSLIEATNDSENIVRGRAIDAIAMLGDPGDENEHSFADEREPSLTVEVYYGRHTSVIGIPSGVARSRRGRRHASASPEDCWIPDGTEVDVAGRTMRGFVYVGKDLGPVAANPWLEIEPALIDPSLPVAASAAESQSRHVWPITYENLTSPERAGYLDWLAGGRVDPRVDAKYIELFLAGLERRVLVDVKQSAAAHAEVDAIEAEVRRLIGCYPEHQGVIYGARSFLELLCMPSLERNAATLEPPTCALRTWRPPLELRLGLGSFAQAGQALPAAWALSWLWCSPEAYLRTPAERCRDEFGRLFGLRYSEHYKRGLKLRSLKQRVAVEHHAFNQGIPRDCLHHESELPDVVSADHLVNALRRLGGECSDELDAYSRYLGRHPEARSDLRALALLPRELLDDEAFPILAELRRMTTPLVNGHSVKVSAADLIQLLPDVNGKLSKKEAAAVARLFASLDVGMEPDVRFGGPPPAIGQTLVLFRLAPRAPEAPSCEYVAATVLLDFAIAVGRADGSVDAREERMLAANAARAPGIEEPERARLAAHLDWLLAEPSSLPGVKDRCARLSETQRSQIARALVAIAGADRRVSPSKVRVLAKGFDALGLKESSLYEQLHAISAASVSGPVTVRPAEPIDTEYALPPSPPTGELRLDQGLIEAKLAETAVVTTLLAEIFAEASPAPPPQSSGHWSLDAVHVRFARALGERTEWDRRDIDTLASDLNLMPDGALDAINDAAVEVANAPAWHGEDPVEIDIEVLEELLR